jgi:aminomethyltransferase
MTLKATPFHARTVAANRWNAWQNRNGFTLAAHYTDSAEEALAARFGAVLLDLSWQTRLQFSGAQVEDFVARCFTRNPARLKPGEALEALWLNDAGAVRGSGTVVRLGRESFLLLCEGEDEAWLSAAASLFEVAVTPAAAGLLALAGPAVEKILNAAGLGTPAPMSLHRIAWRGLDITLSRLGLGYEIGCAADDALIVWDRLMAAGCGFALLPAGVEAFDILEIESGLLQAGRDFAPARDGFAPQPTPQELGLSSLVDRRHSFNGKAGFLAAGPDTILTGLLPDAGVEPGAVLTQTGQAAGRVLVSRPSPALQQTVCLAMLKAPCSGPLKAGESLCRVVPLPILPLPSPTSVVVSKFAPISISGARRTSEPKRH